MEVPKRNKNNIEYFLGDDEEDLKIDKYKLFLDWCDKEGVHMPKLEYPAYFEGGLCGTRVKEDIEHREAYLYVPYKMLLSVNGTQEHHILGPIIIDNPQCFLEDDCDDWEQLTLTLRIMYEMTFGKKSYWYPYLRMMPDVNFTSKWEPHEIEMAQDETLFEALSEYHAEIEETWQNFKEVLQKYPKVFGPKFVDEGLFMNIYAQVCTRCFGYGLDSTSMIPMADNLNHSSVDITYEVISTQFHLQGPSNPKYYRVNKFMNDYSHIFKKLNISTEVNGQPNINIYGRFNRKLYEMNQQSLSIENIRANLALTKHIWELPFYHDDYFEDNDTSDEDSEEEEDDYSKRLKILDKHGNETVKIKLRPYHGLEYFIKKEQEYLT